MRIFILYILPRVPHLYVDESFLVWRIYVPVLSHVQYHYLIQNEPQNVSPFFLLFLRVFIFFGPYRLITSFALSKTAFSL